MPSSGYWGRLMVRKQGESCFWDDNKGSVASGLTNKPPLIWCTLSIAGVSSIETDVAAKSVVVQADASVSPQLMLEKLEKVRRRFLTFEIFAARDRETYS